MDPATAQAIKSASSAVAGAGAGAATGYLDNKYNKKALSEYIKQQGNLHGDISSMAGAREGQTSTAYSGLTAGMNENAQSLYGALKGTDYSKYNVTAPGAYQGKSVNDLTTEIMNPMTSQLESAASGAVQGSAANAGKLFSGITAQNIANATATVRANEIDKARSDALQMDAANRNDFQNQFQNQVTASGTNKANTQQGITNLATLFDAQTGQFTNQQNELSGIRSAADQALLQSKGEAAAAAAQKAGTKSGFAAAVSGGLQGLASALK